MTEFDDALLEPFMTTDLTVPLIHLTTSGMPTVQIKVGEEVFEYDRSFPIKGHAAVMPQYLQEQVVAGKNPLLIERPTRFYVYFQQQ